MSQFTKEIISTVKYLKKSILERLDAGEELSMDEVDNLTQEAFKKTALDMGLTYSTVSDKCTRQMDLTNKEFYELVKNYLVGINDDFEDRVAAYCKFPDSPADVKADIRRVR